MCNVVGYVRVSTDTQMKNGEGLNIQKQEIEKYCKANKFNLENMFSDEAVSGANENRQGIKDLLDYVNKNKSPVTPPGIEPTTLRLVAQCVNQTRHSFTWNITQLIQCMHSRCLLIRQRQNGFTNHWKCLPFNPSQHKRKGRGASRRVASANSDMTNEIVSLCFKVAR